MSNNQNYEDYWQITLAYTDYNGSNFIDCLSTCIDFIDEYKDESYSEDKYKRLQELLIQKTGIAAPSVRKAINQLVKLGFIQTKLAGYPDESKKYLEANTDRKRKSLLSKIVYSYSSLSSSVSEDSTLHQINFLINTLVEVGKITKAEIPALMLVDIAAVSKGFVTKEELDVYIQQAQTSGFADRKYNQISHLVNLLEKLEEIVFVQDELYFTEDAKRIFGEALAPKGAKKRNPYLHLLYKNQLKAESLEVTGSESCMVEKLSYPILIASHIKPFIQSTDVEAYDPNNGLLLSQNLDGLFDKGNISFEDDGHIIISDQLEEALKEKLSEYKLPKEFINEERKQFLAFHRDFFKDKLFS